MPQELGFPIWKLLAVTTLFYFSYMYNTLCLECFVKKVTFIEGRFRFIFSFYLQGLYILRWCAHLIATRKTIVENSCVVMVILLLEPTKESGTVPVHTTTYPLLCLIERTGHWVLSLPAILDFFGDLFPRIGQEGRCVLWRIFMLDGVSILPTLEKTCGQGQANMPYLQGMHTLLSAGRPHLESF